MVDLVGCAASKGHLGQRCSNTASSRNARSSAGLSSSGSMKGADIMVGRFNDEDVFVLEDRYSDNFVTPSFDEEQIVELLEGGTSGGYTWWVGTRRIKRDCSSMDRLNDLDAYQYDAIQNIIAAGGSSHAFERHSIRTATGLPLLEDVDVIPEPVEATQSISLRPEDENGAPFVVPAARTTYWCTPFTFPNDTKYHTVKVVPRVADHGLMHHMIMYLCNGEPKGASECSRPTGGVDEICSGSYNTWTPGRTTMYTPLEAGMPFGKGSTTYFMLQMHYDNPEGRTGVVDTTSFDFIYTSELRQHDLGLMWLGALLSDINIPPGQPAHLVDIVCSSECTQLRIPEGGVAFVDVRDHMHRFGRSAGTEVMRDGKVIQDLTWNRYDYNHQRGAQVTFKLLPGDSMRHWCTYDTLNTTNQTVIGGRTAEDEMCFGFLMHYPATLGMCIAYPGETATICSQQVLGLLFSPTTGVMSQTTSPTRRG
ncbi:Tyramine beta-hydroxylase [Diplonema papillatum]|nr:Tyramine beta-hydroxylase [Diplonema papillatum]KAJ9455607.1 Tyramine beta-hydroxylase [Diplonema papillatum]